MDNYNKHYIRLDADSNIIKGFSNAFEQPQDGDICINEQGGRHFELFGQINPQLRNEQGVYLYRYIDGELIVKTTEEIDAEMPMPKQPVPTLEQQVQALSVALLEMAGEIYG